MGVGNIKIYAYKIMINTYDINLSYLPLQIFFFYKIRYLLAKWNSVTPNSRNYIFKNDTLMLYIYKGNRRYLSNSIFVFSNQFVWFFFSWQIQKKNLPIFLHGLFTTNLSLIKQVIITKLFVKTTETSQGSAWDDR